MTRLAAVLLVVALLTLYATWTAGRLDRLHVRVEAAWAALDAQLVRRAAAARALAADLPAPHGPALHDAAQRVLDHAGEGREAVENDLSRALRAVLPVGGEGTAFEELATAATRVGLARSFFNTAVQDARAVRLRRLPRALRLAGHAPLPQYFEIDDTAVSR